jgi:hypothetical protein
MASSIDSDLKLNLNELKVLTGDLFHVYYYVIISSTKFMVVATKHMAMECLLELHFEFINGLDF